MFLVILDLGRYYISLRVKKKWWKMLIESSLKNIAMLIIGMVF